MQEASVEKAKFTKYQIFIIVVLAVLQFSVVLDFMILSPLGYILMPELKIDTAQFGWVVSAYAFSAFASGLLAAGFADKFDRKKLLLFFYAGFIGGTLLCGIADTYSFLLFARVVTGLFGGVIASIVMSIVTDMFQLQVRGRVMGLIQMAFAASQVLGIPAGLFLAGRWNWHFPFIMIVVISALLFAVLAFYLKPIDGHLKIKTDKNAFMHLLHVVSRTRYLKAFAATTLLATGGYMLMPFGSDYAVHNLGLDEKNELPLLYLYTGVATIFVMPLAGFLSDKVGKYKVFFVGSVLSIGMLLIYCNLDVTPFVWIVVLNIVLFIGIMSRIAPAQALMSAIPEPQDRGAFMSVNSSIQQLSGGISSIIAGLIVIKMPNKSLGNYDVLGYVVTGAIIITLVLMYVVHKMVQKTEKPSVN